MLNVDRFVPTAVLARVEGGIDIILAGVIVLASR